MQKLFKSTLLSLLYLFGSLPLVQAQCESYLPFKKGTEMELTNYDKNKKATSKVTHKVIGESVSAGVQTVSIQTETIDLKKNKKVGRSTYDAKCEGGVFKFQFSSLVLANNEQMASMKDFEVKSEGDFIEIPSSPQVGQTLQGGQMKTQVSVNGTHNPMLNQTISVSNRKVEAMEKVTTPAGTFDCVKISEEIEFKTLFKIQMKSMVWYAKNVGLVKSEAYSKKGALLGTTELTALKK